jgi:hypothetical protein
MNELPTINFLFNNKNISINCNTDIYEKSNELKKIGININGDDPDDSEISKKIYEVVFPFYNENSCRGETLNTYSSTFGSKQNKNWRLKNIIEKENITNGHKSELYEKIENFWHTIHTIGNFTVLERGHPHSVNCARGTGVLHDSWPLTLLCIQDYINGYTMSDNNPLKNIFDTNESTILFFKRYKIIENGFELFCDDHYLSPKYYDTDPQFAYVDELKNGKYKVRLDLFDGLSFSKPLATTTREMEQFIDNATQKIIKRGNIILNKYLSSIGQEKL